MQVTMLVFTKKKSGSVVSLRKQIGNDLAKGCHEHLYVESHKDVDRSPGWMKVKADAYYGVLNIEWDSSCHMLVVRAVSKGQQPYPLLGVFVEYILAKHGKRVQNMLIQMT